MGRKRNSAACIIASLTWALPTAAGQELPEWLTVKGSLQARFESIDNRLKRGEAGSNQGFFTRALLEITVRDTFLEATAEMMDARVFGEPSDATTTTGQVNTAELLQGFLAGTFTNAFEPGDTLRVQLGRHTMNIGSRRLVARNVYRNTINAFTGVNAQWESAAGAWGRAFYTLPIQRLPGNGDPGVLRDGDVEFDEERTSVRFWGFAAGKPDLALSSDVEAYVFGLHEGDANGLATADRHITTIGTRWRQAPARGALHWEFESAFQFGETNGSASSAARLDHDAHLHHGTIGLTLDAVTKPRIEALFDLASGDVNPNDDENNRFDSLFGIPRQDFGPTGLFRAIARANLVSPGLRFTIDPAPRWNLMVTHRFNYLASDRDAWTTGYRDPSGASGSHIGNMSEMRLRYDAIPGSFKIEVGAAYHAAGTFAESAPGAASPGDAAYGYVQTTWSF